jgi:hypothetical protein
MSIHRAEDRSGRASRACRAGLRGASIALIVAGIMVATSQPASASPPDLNGDRISWNGALPCSDGPSGTSVSTSPRYNAPGAGVYRTRVGLYRSSDGGRLALSRLGENRPTRPGWVGFFPWSYWTSYRGDTYVVGYVFRHLPNGVDQLVARESIPCW